MKLKCIWNYRAAASTGPGGGYEHQPFIAGQSIILEGKSGWQRSNSFTNTVFSDAGAGLLPATGAPYTNTYKPVNAFTTITPATATNANGTWHLVILDDVNSGFTGVFNNATLCITYTTTTNTFTWTSTPTGYNNTGAGPFTVTPAGNTDYNVLITAQNGCTATDAVTITVTPAPTITPTSPTVCSGTTTANLAYTATGTPNQYSITYDAVATGAGFANVAFVALPGSPITLVVPAGAPAATYNGTITVRNGAAGCPSIATPFTVKITAAPTITLGPNPTVCAGATTANLPYTGTSTYT